MTTFGFLFMVASVASITIWWMYCMYLVLATPSTAAQEHGMIGIDTRDADPPPTA